MKRKALIIVDMQHDFFPTGKLAVPKGNEIVPTIVTLMTEGYFDEIVFTQDWHPEGHGSFASANDVEPFTTGKLGELDQVFWPDHCIQGDEGSKIVGLMADLIDEFGYKVFRKGMDFNVDSYSGFADNGGKNPSGLEAHLKEREIDQVFVCGLAADYCVKFTAIDSAKAGFETKVIWNATKGIFAESGAEELTKDELKKAGVTIGDVKPLFIEEDDLPYFERATTLKANQTTES